MKTYLALLLGMSVLFTTESMSISPTPEPNKLTSAHAAHDATVTLPDVTWRPTQKPEEDSVAAADTAASSPTAETEEAIVSLRSSNDSTTALVATNTVGTTASSSEPRLIHTSTAAGEPQPSHGVSETAKPTEHQLPTIGSSDMNAPATTSAAVSSPQPKSTAYPEATSELSTEDQLHRQSSTASTDLTLPATTSVAVSSPQPISTANPDVTSELSSATSSAANSTQTPVFIQDLTSPSASATTAMTENPTSEAAPASEPTSRATSTTGAEVSSTSQPVSGTNISTSQFPDSAGSGSTAETPTASFSTDSAATTAAAVSTSAAGILIHRVPKRGSIPTTNSTTTASREVSPSTEVQPCSTRGIVKQCLIAVAALAVFGTIFMVSTIVLCAKLSARKYKLKKPLPATEMMCISALLPESDFTYTRHRNPARPTNGVLVIHAGGDSDEDVGDNLTLSSFLPENDRLV